MSKKTPINLESLEIELIGLVTPGLKVLHPHFGVGTVEEIFLFESGENTIRINFDKVGSKALVPEFARLSLLPEEIKLTPNNDSLIAKLKGLFK